MSKVVKYICDICGKEHPTPTGWYKLEVAVYPLTDRNVATLEKKEVDCCNSCANKALRALPRLLSTVITETRVSR